MDEMVTKTIALTGVATGVCLATMIAYAAKLVLVAYPSCAMPMTIGALLGFIPSAALIAIMKRGDVFHFCIRIALCPMLGIVIGGLIGYAMA